MDFLPLPEGVPAHEEVPFLGGPYYDNSGFAGYDRRQGWNVKALREGNIDAARDDWDAYEQTWLSTLVDPDTTEVLKNGLKAFAASLNPNRRKRRRYAFAAAFIQTWTLFGLFHQLLKRPVPRWELTYSKSSTDSDGKSKYVTVRRLYGEFFQTRDQWLQDPAAALEILPSLHEAALVISNVVHSSAYQKFSTIPVSVYLVLAALIEDVDSSLRVFTYSKGDAPLTNVSPPHIRYAYFAKKLHDQQAWCPSMTARIGRNMRIAGLYYTSLVPALTIEQNHDRCNTNLCVASNIEKASYSVRHVLAYCLCRRPGCSHQQDGLCACEHLATPDMQFRRAFDDEGFPVITLRGGTIEVKRYEFGINYVAISHPWSDGRGNPTSNALPICQLRSIAAYVAAATPEGNSLFWIDTLCVPIEEPLRNTAVLRMAEVYSLASHVLVLSDDLLSTKLPPTIDEVLVRIFCSKWNTRLWLMQEAALARELLFQFSDTTLSHAALEHAVNMSILKCTDEPETAQSFRLATLSLNNVNSVARIRDSNNEGKYCSMKVVWEGLRHRTSSRVLDATICCSVLLGTDLSKVLDAPNESKMQTFWSCQSRVPTSVLFAFGPRLQAAGFHWAPSDLLNPETNGSFIRHPVRLGPDIEAQLTVSGLLVSGLEAVLMDLSKVPLSKDHICRFSMRDTPYSYFFILESEGEPWTALKKNLGKKWHTNCALLLHELPGIEGLASAAMTLPLPPPRQENLDCDDGTLSVSPVCARYIVPLRIAREDGAYARQLFAQHGFTTETFSNRRKLSSRQISDLVDVRHIGAAQQWCIF